MSLGTFTLSSDIRSVAKRYGANGPMHKALGRELHRALVDAAGSWERQVKRRFVNYTGTSRSDRLQLRSGEHRRGIKFKRFGSGWDGGALLISQGPGSRVHEFDKPTTIKGKPWLSIPLPHTLTPSGGRVQAKFMTRPVGKHWRMPDNSRTWIKPSKTGSGLTVFGNVKGKAVPLRALKREVTVPGGRLGMRDTWRSKPMRVERKRLVKRAVKRALARAKRGGKRKR